MANRHGSNEVRWFISKIHDRGLSNGILISLCSTTGNKSENSIIMQTVYDKLRKGKKAQWLCKVDKIRSYGYVPDLAKGTAMLGNTESAFNQIWNLPTDTQKLTGRDWINLFAEELKCDPKFTVLPNWILKTAGIFMPIMSELAEMNYQYDRDYFF